MCPYFSIQINEQLEQKFTFDSQTDTTTMTKILKSNKLRADVLRLGLSLKLILTYY